MKAIVHFILALLISQNIFSQNLKIGVCLNPQITWMNSESKSVDSEGARGGISGGLNMDSYFQKNYALTFGLHLSTQAGSLRYTDGTEISTDDSIVTLLPGSVVDYRINTIAIPVGLKLKSNEIGFFSYYAQVGFTNQFRIKAKATSGDVLDKDPIKDEIKPYNLSYHFGAGIEYALSEDTALSFGIIYQNGFIDLTEHAPKIYMRALSFCLGVIF